MTGLKTPQNVAIDSGGRVLTVEFGRKRIVAIDPRNGSITELAADLPIDIRGNGEADLAIGLAVGPTGAIYVTSDVENSIYKLTKQ